MARVILPESKLKTRRRRRRVLIGLLAVLTIVLLFGASVWLAHASFLRITAVAISGNSTLASSTLQSEVEERISGSYLYVYPKNNIFLYSKHIADDLVEQHPTIKHIEVTAENFHTLHVAIVERQPVALWCGDTPETPEPCMFLDDTGVAYASAPEFSVPVYIQYFGALNASTTPRTYLYPEKFVELEALVGELAKQQANDSLRSIYIDQEQDVHISFASGFVLLFDLSSNAATILERFSLALTADPFTAHPLSDFLYLDLRFGTKLYYKLK